MSFKAVFELNNSPLDNLEVVTCDYRFHQTTDDKGRPSSTVRGGQIVLMVRGTEPRIVEWMLDPYMQKSGLVRFLRKDAEATLKEVAFENAYCIQFSEKMRRGAITMLTISPEKITVGGVTYTNIW